MSSIRLRKLVRLCLCVILFTTLLAALGCGDSSSDGEIVVRSSDGKVLLKLSAVDSSKAARIVITPVTEGLDPSVTSYSFEPSGLTFDSPARVEFDVSDLVSRSEINPIVMFSLSGDTVEILDNQDLSVSASGTATLSGDMSHFSLLAFTPDMTVSVLVEDVPSSLPMGESFTAPYRVIVSENTPLNIVSIDYLLDNTLPIQPNQTSGSTPINELFEADRGLSVGRPTFQQRSEFNGIITSNCSATQSGTGRFRPVFGLLNYTHTVNVTETLFTLEGGLIASIDNSPLIGVDKNLTYTLSISEDIVCTGSDSSSENNAATDQGDADSGETTTGTGGTTQDETTSDATDTGASTDSDTSTGGEGTEETPETPMAMPGIEISQTTFSFDHTVIVTDCPQPVGSFVLTNTGNETLQVTITGANADASNIDLGATSLTLEPGASQEVSVGFNCGRGTSFTAEFLVEGVGATSGETTSTGLQVVGNVMM